MNELPKIASLLIDKLTSWYEMLIKGLPNIAIAIFVFIIGVQVAKYVKKMVSRIAAKVVDNRAVASILEKVAYISILLVTVFTTLSILQLEKAVTSLLAGAGVIGLALGFAFQEIASNFVSGIFIAFQKPFKPGDIIEIGDLFGTINSIDLRTTTVVTVQGLEVLVPNRKLFTDTVTNLTLTPKRRIDLEVGVSYAEDLERVAKIAGEALEGIEERISDRPVEIYFKEFGGSSINFDARVWIHYPAHINYIKARHAIVTRIKKAFDENGITIPFPIRTLDFGIKGGRTLEQTLAATQPSEVQTQDSASDNP